MALETVWSDSQELIKSTIVNEINEHVEFKGPTYFLPEKYSSQGSLYSLQCCK